LFFPILLAFKLRWDSLLPVLIYFQLLVIWAQAEIALRQHVLFSMQFEPSFNVRLEQGILYLKNVSKNSAYNVFIGRILNSSGKPLPPDKWKKEIHTKRVIANLAPNQEVALCTFKHPESIIKEKFSIETLYSNQLGELRTFLIQILDPLFLSIIPEKRKNPGFLLTLFEDIYLCLKFLKYKK